MFWEHCAYNKTGEQLQVNEYGKNNCDVLFVIIYLMNDRALFIPSNLQAL